MRDQLFECNILKRSTRNIQMAIAVPSGLAMGYLIINMLNAYFGHRLFMPSWMLPSIFIFLTGGVSAALLWFFGKGKLSIYKVGSQDLEIEIGFPNSDLDIAKGKWTCIGQYTRTYARYGMYYKNLALSLWCNDQPFCLLRHQLGGLASAPNGFIELEELFNPGGAEYWCKKTPLVFEVLSNLNQQTKPE